MSEINQNKNFAGIYRDSLSNLTGFQRLLFLELLVSCNHSDNPNFSFEGVTIPIKRGQWITSYRKLAKKTGFKLQPLRTLVTKLKKAGIIDVKSVRKLTHGLTHDVTHGGILITICSIDNYLLNSLELTHELTGELTTNNNDSPSFFTKVKEETSGDKNVDKSGMDTMANLATQFAAQPVQETKLKGYWQLSAIKHCDKYSINGKDRNIVFKYYKQNSDLMDRVFGYLDEGKRPIKPIAAVLAVRKKMTENT